MSRPDDLVYLDPREAAEAQRRRRRLFHTVEVPRLRMVGSTFCAIGIVFHNWLVFDQFSWTATARHTAEPCSSGSRPMSPP
jgi:hypothetical protein